MIESIMYCGIGFLLAALIGLAVFPLVHDRAVRLTKRRLQDAIPQSMTEIQADKDLLRAEFAISTRRLEMSVEQLKNQTASQLAELSKKDVAINKLKMERDERNFEVISLKTRVEALKEQLAEFNTTKDRRPIYGAPMNSSLRSPRNDQHHEDDSISLIPESPTTEVAKMPIDPSQSGPLKEQCHGDDISLAARQSSPAEENRLGRPARGLGGTRDPPDRSPGMARKGSAFSAELRSVEPSFLRPLGSENDQFVSDSRSIGTRILRSLAFLIAVLIGIGGTFAWQSHSDEAKAMIRTWALSLGWLLPAGTTKSVPDAAFAAAQTGSTPPRQASRQDAARPQSTPVAQRPAPPAAATSPEVVQQLEAMVRDLAAVRSSVQQLADKQEQMAQNIAALQTAEQDAGQQNLSPPPHTRAKLTPWPETRPTTIAGWTLHKVTNGTAILEGPNGIWRAARGDTVPGVGRVDSIVRWGNRWIVATSRGLISTP